MTHVRLPAVADQFYPGSADELGETVENLLGHARNPGANRRPKAIVSPHAGYVYSGEIAASAWAAVLPESDRIRRIVIIGPAHRVYLREVAAPGVDAMRTPLGDVPVDRAAIAAVEAIVDDEVAHSAEHGIEVQLPFAQAIAPQASVVPLVVGDVSRDRVAHILDALWGGDETLIVISSDLSHFLPYDAAVERDQETTERIVALDPHPVRPDEACGAAAINGFVTVARARGLRGELLDLRNSGDTAGSRRSVVGYAAIAFHEDTDVH